MRLSEKYEFRSIHREEAEQAAEIEQICFPPAEAISRADVIDRVEKIPELFLVAVDRKNGKLAGYLTGFTTSEEAFQDKFFTNADLCDPDGKNNMLLGLEVLPKYRGQGLARELMMRYLDREQKRGRERAVLTCVDEKVEMYRRMGFEYIGISAPDASPSAVRQGRLSPRLRANPPLCGGRERKRESANVCRAPWSFLSAEREAFRPTL